MLKNRLQAVFKIHIKVPEYRLQDLTSNIIRQMEGGRDYELSFFLLLFFSSISFRFASYCVNVHVRNTGIILSSGQAASSFYVILQSSVDHQVQSTLIQIGLWCGVDLRYKRQEHLALFKNQKPPGILVVPAVAEHQHFLSPDRVPLTSAGGLGFRPRTERPADLSWRKRRQDEEQSLDFISGKTFSSIQYSTIMSNRSLGAAATPRTQTTDGQ